jgi:hypothetical protein
MGVSKQTYESLYENVRYDIECTASEYSTIQRIACVAVLCRAVVPKVGDTAPLGGGGITEVGANRYERWKGALLLSQGAASRQVVHLFL